jgi:transcription initiation factor TFIIH subunit 4
MTSKFIEYLCRNARLLETLYASEQDGEWVCKAVFRGLGAATQQYVMRLLFVEGALPLSVLRRWSDESDVAEQRHEAALSEILSLKIGIKAARRQAASVVLLKLNVHFRRNLQRAVCNCVEQPFRAKSKTLNTLKSTSKVQNGQNDDQNDEESDFDAAFLRDYSSQCWESILHFLLGSAPRDGTVPSERVMNLLVESGLFEREAPIDHASSSTAVSTIDDDDVDDNDDGGRTVTAKGFQFLLQDVHTQTWALIEAYMATLLDADGETHSRWAETAVLLAKLSFLRVGHSYSLDALSERQRATMSNLREFGLVYQRSASSRRYFPTQVAVNLFAPDVAAKSSGGGGDEQHSGEGYIVVETNLRVYAYTSSVLRIELLSLIVQMLYRLPDLVVGVLTRESVQRALSCGIATQQILLFLSQHAHPKARANVPGGVPESAIEQIRLWGSQRKRFDFTPGMLYDNFGSDQEFKRVVAFARERQLLIWIDVDKQMLMVHEHAHQDIRTFVRDLSNRA